MKATRTTASLRIKIIAAFFVCGILIILTRLFILQVQQGAEWRDRGAAQYVLVSQDVFRRGNIYVSERAGAHLPAAAMQGGYTVSVDFRKVDEPQRVLDALSALIPTLDRVRFMEYANEPQKKYREVARIQDDTVAEAVRSLDFTSVIVSRTQWRVYPYGDLFGRTIGFVGYDEASNLVGRYGVERAYEDILARASEEVHVNPYAEFFGKLKTEGTDTKNVREADLITTLEPVVSQKLHAALMEVQDKYQSELTGGIIMNPKTGAIYAMDAVPSFDPNDRSGIPLDRYQNPNTLSTFEFGSIIKPLTMAAGIDAGVVSRSSTYYDTGCATFNTLTVCDYDGRARGTTDMQQVLSQSLNLGVAHVAGLLGHDRFRTYFTNLRLGSETGIDAGGEQAGNIRNLDSKRAIEHVTASYGQGISMSPVETIRALATLANKGVLPAPRIGDALRLPDGSEEPIRFPDGDRVFSEDTVAQVTSMLVEVVDHALKGGKIRKDHYSAAAKTGTAFLVSPSGGYDKNRFFHSFFGYFPAYDPQFIILLYTKDPKNVQYASETLTPAFAELEDFLLRYYEVQQDR